MIMSQNRFLSLKGQECMWPQNQRNENTRWSTYQTHSNCPCKRT